MLKLKFFVAMAAFTAVNLSTFADLKVNPIPDHPDWGYTVTDFPEAPDDIAIVFTNHNPESSMFWKMPHGADNVQFLVVGGGGAGGAAGAGPGGGGGGVVTGLVTRLSKNSLVNVVVGAGGTGGLPTAGSGSGTKSSFKVDEVDYITANGGGGATSQYTYTGSNGGSGAGGRGSGIYTDTMKSYSGGTATQGSIGVSASNNVASVTMYGFPGGAGHSAYASGGGGGATAAGTAATSTSSPGNGGAGLISEITGVATTYGSGGGGAHSINRTDFKYGTSGVGAGIAGGSTHSERCGAPNQGGGGGGASRDTAALKQGGNGGSGIVVIRYKQKPPVFKVIVR